MSKLVQCFYNANYNHGSHGGQSKAVWGFGWFELVDDDANPLCGQIMEQAKLKEDETFNLNLTAFTPLHDNLLEGDKNE